MEANKLKTTNNKLVKTLSTLQTQFKSLEMENQTLKNQVGHNDEELVAEQMRNQLETLLQEKAKLVKENARLQSENSGLQELLSYTLPMGESELME